MDTCTLIPQSTTQRWWGDTTESCNDMGEFRNCVMRERRQIQKNTHVWFHLYKVVKQAKESLVIKVQTKSSRRVRLTRKNESILRWDFFKIYIYFGLLHTYIYLSKNHWTGSLRSMYFVICNKRYFKKPTLDNRKVKQWHKALSLFIRRN